MGLTAENKGLEFMQAFARNLLDLHGAPQLGAFQACCPTVDHVKTVQ